MTNKPRNEALPSRPSRLFLYRARSSAYAGTLPDTPGGRAEKAGKWLPWSGERRFRFVVRLQRRQALGCYVAWASEGGSQAPAGHEDLRPPPWQVIQSLFRCVQVLMLGRAGAMVSKRAFICSLGSIYLSLLFVFLLMDVYARPANNSALKEKAADNRDENEILPPDHLNGVKMEMDGHLNKEFHQEVFLGKEMEEFDEDSEPRRNRRKLVVIFSKVDVNKDKMVSAKEMQRWIMEKTEEHFQEAVEENKLHFRAVDPDGDGHVSWEEYKIKFLASKGFNEKEVAEKVKNNEELKIDEETQEVLDNLKDRWYQADNPPADLLLNEEEFLSFLHPEHSIGMLKFMVKEIVRDLDQNADKKLTLSEFISLPVGTVENQQAQDIDDDWVKDRKKEFEEVIDADHDGIVTMEELEEYMDPMNEYNALNEAKQMIAVADENQNHHLELEEILKYSEYFTGSKLMDYARNVHEEF